MTPFRTDIVQRCGLLYTAQVCVHTQFSIYKLQNSMFILTMLPTNHENILIVQQITNIAPFSEYQ